MKIDGFFLEYDDERSGDFAPLRFAPKSATIVLGLMSSKKAAAEPKDLVSGASRKATNTCPGECALKPPVRLFIDRPRQRSQRSRPVDRSSRAWSRSPKKSGVGSTAGAGGGAAWSFLMEREPNGGGGRREAWWRGRSAPQLFGMTPRLSLNQPREL